MAEMNCGNFDCRFNSRLSQALAKIFVVHARGKNRVLPTLIPGVQASRRMIRDFQKAGGRLDARTFSEANVFHAALESVPIYIYIEPQARLQATLLFTGPPDTFVSFHLRHGTGPGYVLSAS